MIIQLRWRSPGLEFAAGPSPKKGVLLAIFAANRRSRLAQRFRRRILNSYVPGLGGYMRRTKLINRVLRAQEPPPKPPEWRRQPFWCRYCSASFTDRNELLAHLDAEKRRDQSAPEP